jgi:hypothetical protein
MEPAQPGREDLLHTRSVLSEKDTSRKSREDNITMNNNTIHYYR